MSADFTQIIRSEHLPARIATQFSQQIRKGTLKPGDKLPTEHAMSRTFGVSRTVIREAIAHLRNEGLIETRQGVGAFVVERPARHIRLSDEGVIGKHAFRHLFQLRVPLEIEAAGLAALHHGPEHLARLDAAMDRMTETDGNAADGIQADLDFHMAIAAATGNDYLQQFLAAISDRIMHSIIASRRRIRLDALTATVAREHRALRGTIAARDPVQARAAMRAHMIGSAERVALKLDLYP